MLVTRAVLENIYTQIKGIYGPCTKQLACACSQASAVLHLTWPAAVRRYSGNLSRYPQGSATRRARSWSTLQRCARGRSMMHLTWLPACRQCCAADRFVDALQRRLHTVLMLFMPTPAGWALGPHHQGALPAQPGGEEPEPACGSAALSYGASLGIWRVLLMLGQMRVFAGVESGGGVKLGRCMHVPSVGFPVSVNQVIGGVSGVCEFAHVRVCWFVLEVSCPQAALSDVPLFGNKHGMFAYGVQLSAPPCGIRLCWQCTWHAGPNAGSLQSAFGRTSVPVTPLGLTRESAELG